MPKAASTPTTLEEIPLTSIAPHPRNVRRHLGTEAEMAELADSIRANGIIEPLIVGNPFRTSAKGNGPPKDWRYTLITGHRRLVGALDAGRSSVPCIVRHDLDTPAKQAEAMLVENSHRKDLTVTEEADGYQELMSFDGYTPAVIAKKLGRSKAFVTGRLSLAGLPERARECVDGGQLSITDALELAAFTDPAIVAELSEYVGTRDWSWRLNQAKGDLARAQAARENPPPAPPDPVETISDPPAAAAEPADRASRDTKVIPEGRTTRAALIRTLDTAARVRHAHLARVIATGDTAIALAIARTRVAQAAKDAFYDQEVVTRVLGPDHDRTIKAMTMAQAVIALDVLAGLSRDANLAQSASAWRQDYTSGWREHLSGALGYEWSPAEVELLGQAT